MGTRIEAVATATRGGLSVLRGSLGLSDVAARTCLQRGARRADELDLLIHAGLYKPRNLAEPALASIIQEDIGANPGHPSTSGHHGTFSFDVINGGCGVLTALQLVDTFVGGNSAGLGMIVAADADPSPDTSRDFRFAPVGGAVLLGHDSGGRGFSRFDFRTFVEDRGLFEAAIRWHPGSGFLGRGKNVLVVREDSDFGPRCVARATEVVSEFLDREGLVPRDVDLLIANTMPRGFAHEVARGLGIPDDRVPRVRAGLLGAHTAGPLASLEASIASGRFATARHVLFVSAGAGITIGVGLYRNEGRNA